MSDEGTAVSAESTAAEVVAGAQPDTTQAEAPASSATDAAQAEAKPGEAPAQPDAKSALRAEAEKVRKATERVREESRMRKEYEARIKELEERASVLDLLDKDPDEALKRIGKSFDQVAKAKLAKLGMAKKAAEIPEEIRSELESLRSQLEETRAAAVEAEASKMRAQLQTEITNELRNETNYELLNTSFGPSAPLKVFELIQRHYQRTAEAGEPEVLTAQQAASMLEGALEESIARVASTRKARSKLGIASDTPERTVGEKVAAALEPSLTNQLASPASSGPDTARVASPRVATGLEFLRER